MLTGYNPIVVHINKRVRLLSGTGEFSNNFICDREESSSAIDESFTIIESVAIRSMACTLD
jgi:hypothetical protein